MNDESRSDVIIIVFGSTEDRSAQGLAGAAKQLASDFRALVLEGEYQPEAALAALTEACRGAQVILLGNDTYSQELAPRLAHRLGGACAGDGTAVELVDGKVRVTRQVYGGKANAVIEMRRSPAVVWLRARSFAAARIASVTSVSSAASQGPQVVERHAEGAGTARLEDARVIVSGGRGIGGSEGFKSELEPLAELLDAQMAASRAACDAGWVPPTWQVGQTGKKVAPDLYLAIAITGASQHMAGISEAKTIAAINIDPDAPIFKHARFGIVEDYRRVLPLLRQRLEELRK
jgi:electron transfer flavoprotein alpha subunit